MYYCKLYYYYSILLPSFSHYYYTTTTKLTNYYIDSEMWRSDGAKQTLRSTHRSIFFVQDLTPHNVLSHLC